MINVSNNFRTALKSNRSGYIAQIAVKLVDNTTFTLTNTELAFDGPSFDDAVCSDTTFGALGGVVVNQLNVTINDRNNTYVQYDFNGATLTPKIGILVNGTPVLINKGVYTIDSANYAGNTIRLTALDNMAKFDKPYSNSSLSYPATLETIIRNCCTVCGVTANISSFPRSTFSIPTRPVDDTITCREVLSWCAQIAGCFCRCNTQGQLEVKWFDQTTLANYQNIDFDSSSFNPQTSGIFYLNSLYSRTLSVDDITITGVKVAVKAQNSSGESVIFNYTSGTSDYAIDLGETNQFITTANAQTIVNAIGLQLIGLTFRAGSIDHLSDPTIEAGDIAVVKDRVGVLHPILITRTSFSATSRQTTVSAAETPSRNSAKRFSELTKSYTEARKLVEVEKTARELAEEELIRQLEAAGGLYCTEVPQQGGGVITYLHNQPDLDDSDVQIMVSDVGITVTADGGDHWYGLTVNGDLIARIISATGINADWINTGEIRSPNGNNYWNLDTGELHIEAVDNLKIGTKNILRGTAKMEGSSSWARDKFYKRGTGTVTFEYDLTDSPVTGVDKGVLFTTTQADTSVGIAQLGSKIRGEIMTHSVFVKGKAGDKIILRCFWGTGAADASGDKTLTIEQDDVWERKVFTSTVVPPNPGYNYYIGYVYFKSNTVGNSCVICAPMLEYGTIPSDWGPADEDIYTDYRSEISQTADSITATVSANQTILNLLPSVYYRENLAGNEYTYNGVTWTLNSDGTVTATGTASGGGSSYAFCGGVKTAVIPPVKLDPTKKYTLSGSVDDDWDGEHFRINARFYPVGVEPNGTNNGTPYTDVGYGVTVPEGYEYVMVYATVYNGTVLPPGGVDFSPMLEVGDTKHEYQSTHNGSRALTSRIEQTAHEISLKVSEEDVTGNYVIGKINLTSTTATIAASHIDLQGAVKITDLATAAKEALVTGTTVKNQYYLSTSTSSATGGSWSDTVSAWSSGKYVWTRVATTKTYASGGTTTTYSTAVYDANLTTALSTASTAQSTANGSVTATVSCYYRSTTHSAPSITTSTSIGTSDDTNNAWEYVMPRPKNDCYFYTCERYTKANGTVSFSLVREMSNLTYTSMWCSATDSTLIDGSYIATGTIEANRISVNDLKAFNADIAGWEITSDAIYKDFTDSNGVIHRAQMRSGSTYNKNYTAFSVRSSSDGGDNWDSQFNVTYGGKLTATEADITGKITSTSGNIGGWGISSSYIQKYGPYTEGTSSSRVNWAGLYAPTSPSSSDKAFGVAYASYNGSSFGTWTYPFYVTYGGDLVTTSATITGGSIDITTNSNTSDKIKLSYNEWTSALVPLGFYAYNSSTKNRAVLQAGGIFLQTDATSLTSAGTNIASLTTTTDSQNRTVGQLFLSRSDGSALGSLYMTSGGGGALRLYDTTATLRISLNDGGMYIYGTSQESFTTYGQHSIDFMPKTSSSNNGGWIDFHYNRSTSDYTSRLIGASGTTTAMPSITNGSDRRMKEDIEYWQSGSAAETRYIEFINKLNPVRYKYRKFDGTHFGFIAQDIVETCNQLGIDASGLIRETALYEPEGDTTKYLSLNYIDIIAFIVNYIQKLNKEIVDLKAELRNGG